MEMKKEKFDRKELFQGLTKAAGKDKCITKTIPFLNNDVPEFLKKLDKFEKESRKACLMVK